VALDVSYQILSFHLVASSVVPANSSEKVMVKVPV
jgi:hypothetical protein